MLILRIVAVTVLATCVCRFVAAGEKPLTPVEARKRVGEKINW